MFDGAYQAPEHENYRALRKAQVGLLRSSKARHLVPHKDSVILEEQESPCSLRSLCICLQNVRDQPQRTKLTETKSTCAFFSFCENNSSTETTAGKSQ